MASSTPANPVRQMPALLAGLRRRLSTDVPAARHEATMIRRDFLIRMTALGAAGLPLAVSAFRARGAKTTYDPAARLDVTVSEVEFRRTAAGRTLMARIYQPAGAGPFPTLLDL